MAFDARALSPGPASGAARLEATLFAQLEDVEPEAGNAARAEGDAHPVDLVLIGIVARRVEPLGVVTPVQQLERQGAAIRADEPERPISLPFPRDASGGRADQHVAPEQRHVR